MTRQGLHIILVDKSHYDVSSLSFFLFGVREHYAYMKIFVEHARIHDQSELRIIKRELCNRMKGLKWQ